MEGDFVSFLPGDNQDLANAATASVIELINSDLSQLLRLPPQQFWQVVLTDKSLHTCLDSFLRFRRRCYDESPESLQGSSDLLLQLSQRVFKVYWRMVHPQEPSTATTTTGSSSSSSSTAAKPKQQAALEPHTVAELLYNQWLLDVPKMLDIAVLYGPGNNQLTGQLLQQLLLLQPKYAQDILTLSEPLCGNLHELSDSVKRLANKALSSGPAAAEGITAELAEAVRYFQDASLTLQAFVDCLPAAAALLLHPQNHGSILLTLAVVHDSVLPLLQRVAQQPGAADASGEGLAPARVLQLQQCLISLVFHLLAAAFCNPAGAAAAGGPAALAAQAAAAAADHGYNSSGARNSSGTSNSSSNKRSPPPGFSSSSSSTANGVSVQQQPGFNPDIQGQELMNLLMLLAHPSDLTSHQQHHKAGLLAAVNHAHHLDVAVAAAVEQGLLALDDAQFDYLLALVDGDRLLLQQRQQHAAAVATATNNSNQPTAAAGSSSAQLPPAAVLAEQVQSIKELLPDYGDGFLTAALFHNSFNTEQTINCLLEGSLPKGLQGLETSLKTWTPPSSSTQPAKQPVGKKAGAAEAGSSSSATTPTGLSWTGLAKEAAAAAAAAPGSAAIPLPSLAQAAAAGPKPSVDRRTGRVLGALPGQVRSLTKNIAYELQYEYDDEYDDSFDDLMGPGNDGVCDIEGEETPAEAAARKAAPGARLRAAAEADEYADEPVSSSAAAAGPSSRGFGGPARGQQQQQQRGKQKDKLWVLDGKIYNYMKEGAQEVAGIAGAEKALKAAKQAAQEIYGLGPGGNVPLVVEEEERKGSSSSRAGAGTTAGSSSSGRASADTAAAAGDSGRGVQGRDGAASSSTGRGQGGGRGRGVAAAAASAGSQGGEEAAGDGGGGSAGRGRGRGSFAHKEQHKAAAANHHRKDRAMAKQAKGMW